MEYKSAWPLNFGRMTATFVILGSLIFAVSSYAQTTLFDYFDTTKAVKANEVVCGIVNRADDKPRCFVVLDYSRILTPDNDPSQKLAKGSVNQNQGVFERVKISELMIEIDASVRLRGENPATASRMIFVKLFWNGKAGKNLVPVAYRDVVAGELELNQNNNLEFKLLEIPTQMSSLGFLFPQKETAQIFGGDPNSEQVKKDLLSWTQDVLNSVLPEVFKGTRYAPAPARKP